MPRVHLDDDKTAEVDPDAIEWGEDEQPDGFVTTDHMEEEIKRRTSSAAENARQEARNSLKSDEDFVREVAESRLGIEVDENLNPQVDSGPDREKIEQRIEADKVQPLRKENEQLQENLQSLRKQQLRGELLEAAQQANVDDMYLQAPMEGDAPPVVNTFGGYFSYDEESGQWVAVDEDGDPRYAADGGYMTPDKFFEAIQDNPQFSGFFNDGRKKGSGYEGGDGGYNGQVNSKADLETLAQKEGISVSKAKSRYIGDNGLEAYENLPDS